VAPLRVVDHDVGVGARGDDALLRVEPEHLGRRGRDDLHPARQGEVPVAHALVDEVHAMLDARQAVGDLGEVALAQLLLLLEAERAVVGRDHAEVVGAQPAPELGLVLAGPQRRRAHVLGALKVLAREVLLAEE
jgi:hypothetical protein